ncbi:MAG: hypothetical protein IKO62_02225 [Bacteroidales bacterium]|nr:hypothetical protein [Bacteroidales bacterium]
MKKSIGIFVFLLSTVVLMSSCKKDVKYLPGTWKVTSAVINGDSGDDVRDVWTLTDGGGCVIECDLDEYFDDIPYDLLNFNGTYATVGNKTLTITSNKFNEAYGYYEQVTYDLDILSLNKKTMMVSGTIKYVKNMESVTNLKTSDISLTLTKR